MSKISREELRGMISGIISEGESTDLVKSLAPATGLVGWLWSTDNLPDYGEIGELLKRGAERLSPVYGLWKSLHPEVQEALIGLARAAKNLPSVANEALKDAAVDAIEAATKAITPDKEEE